MYFNEIHDLDERWSRDDQECLNRFHRLKTIRMLRELLGGWTEE
jgi:hypothetical protein